jgi:hypothetical protein
MTDLVRCAETRRLASRAGAIVAAAIAFSAVTAISAPHAAHAYCRTTTTPVPASYSPTRGCFTDGLVLFWRGACVGYSVNSAASAGIPIATATSVVDSAFTTWNHAACGAGEEVGIITSNLGAVDCSEVKYNPNGPNQNVIVFRDDKWPHSDTNNTLALTTVTFNPDTGEIYDADMEINTHDQRVTLTDPVPPDGYDFASIVTHETGHFLGLAHSGDNRATMFANYTPGATAMRNLTADDVAGVCSVYRPDGTRTVLNGKVTPGPQCDPTPRRGFTTACAEPTTKACGGSSSQIASAAPVTSGWVGLVGALAAMLGLRRKRSPGSRSAGTRSPGSRWRA